ncbi:hypothetical protein VNO80_29230 [Phaseolus coccineus]|uniref:Uncharacterized protein n=1 Tax=Phaseolus coccineus TaxID=3886 RepID=A0AAN9QIA5_PHACN
MAMARNNEDVQELNNSICDTATSDPKEEIEPFSGVVDTEKVREKIESDPFIQQAVHSFLKHSEAKEREEEYDKECAFANSLLKTPESNNGEEHDQNYVSAILDAKHTKTP